MNRAPPQGHSAATVRYQLVDHHPDSGFNIYRLRSVDLDTGASTSTTVTAWLGAKSEVVRVVPNPTDQFATDLVNLPGYGSEAVRLIDGRGREVCELSLQDMAGPAPLRATCTDAMPVLTSCWRTIPAGLGSVADFSGSDTPYHHRERHPEATQNQNTRP